MKPRLSFARFAPITPVVLVAVLAVGAAIALSACGNDDPPIGQTTTPSTMMGSAPSSAAENSMGASSSDIAEAKSDEDVLTGTLPLLNGEPQDLSKFRGDVVLVVNTASECGFTPQFDGLEKLYEHRKDDGFVILGFPADDVAGQEPRDDKQIAKFCKANFGVSFPMFAKSNVIGDEANPLFQKLNSIAGEPGWNFNKYLVDRKGRVVEHFDVGVDPSDVDFNKAIEAQL
jgi:glutathione peroxidase